MGYVALPEKFITPGGREVHALRGISFSIDKGDILCVVGHNGSGKTTLLNCLRRSFQWDEGTIKIDGKPLNNMSTNVVSVFQDVGLGVVGSMTPLENLSLVFSKEPGYIRSIPGFRYKKQIYDFLDKAGLKDRFDSFENTPVAELSGGQRQQVAIMMAVLRQPDLLLLDEFVANLDPSVKLDILNWIRTWIFEYKVTTIMVTHDIKLAEVWGNWIVELLDGTVKRLERTQILKEVPNG